MPRRLTLILLLVLGAAAALSVARVAFWIAFAPADDPMPFATLAEAFYVGAKFDLRLAALLALPLLVIAPFRFADPVARRGARIAWSVYAGLAAAALALFYVLDFGYYAYLQKRLDAAVLQFAADAAISAEMVWQTYPIVWPTLAVSAWIACATLGTWRLAGALARRAETSARRARRVGAHALMWVLMLGALYGKFSYYPLRWVDAFFSPHAFASSLALNPAIHFASTWDGSRHAYDEAAARKGYELLANYLGANPPPGQLSLARDVVPARPLAERPNVVLVFLESFAAYKTGFFGNPLDPTPHFDRLARESLVYARFYTPHTGTARSVFTALTGIPDTAPVSTSSRNPLIVSQHTLVNAFDGYAKHYFLGGSASWGNIRGLLAHNIPGLTIHEEGGYRSPRVDVWGISDLSLFREATQAIDGIAGQPFVAIIQTSGGHRPYTIPDDRGGFESRELADAETQKHGFHSTPEYNAFRFLDHALGEFMATARSKPWYRNTLFVFFGDHGAPGTAPHLSPSEQALQLTNYRVPLVLHAPAFVKPEIVDRVASEVDLLPTVLGVTGQRHRNTTFGRDLRDPRFDDWRFAFTIEHGRVPQIGLVGPKHYFRMHADGSTKGLHALDGADPLADVSSSEPGLAATMEEMTRAYYEVARHLVHHNPNPVAQRGH